MNKSVFWRMDVGRTRQVVRLIPLLEAMVFLTPFFQQDGADSLSCFTLSYCRGSGSSNKYYKPQENE